MNGWRVILLTTTLLAGTAEARVVSDDAATYQAYRRNVDRETAKVYKAHRQEIDPDGLRGRTHGYDLDHATPARCAYAFGWPAAQVASAVNLRVMPAAKNRADGARGCKGAGPFFDG